MKGTVLVTGATGFIGRYVVRYLSAGGWRVFAAARGTAGIESIRDVNFVALPDLGRKVHWSPLLAGVTHAVHLAGIAHAKETIPESQYMVVNAEAAASLASAARAKGLKRLVLLSSVRAQSGPTSSRRLSERDEPKPIDAYGRSKLAGERMVAEALRDSATGSTVLRPVLVYGAGVKGNMRSLFDLAETPWPLPLAGLKARRSVLGLANLASAIEHALEAPACAGGTFLVADEAPVTVPEIIAALRTGLGRGPALFNVPLWPVGALARIIGRGAAWDRLTGDLIVDTTALWATGWVPAQPTTVALAEAIGSESGRS